MREMITFVLKAHTCENNPEIVRHPIFARLILEEKISLHDNYIRKKSYSWEEYPLSIAALYRISDFVFIITFAIEMQLLQLKSEHIIFITISNTGNQVASVTYDVWANPGQILNNATFPAPP